MPPVDVRKYPDATHSAGGIVTCLDQGKLWAALVQRYDGFWVLPKGHVRPDEGNLATAFREIGEETGLREGLTLVAELGAYEFAEHPEDEPRPKLNHFFLFAYVGPTSSLVTDAEHAAASWHQLSDLPAMKYPYQLELLSTANEHLRDN